MHSLVAGSTPGMAASRECPTSESERVLGGSDGAIALMQSGTFRIDETIHIKAVTSIGVGGPEVVR